MNNVRSCDGCTACCDGWLFGEAHGHKFWPGRKCHFRSPTGCSIYENRPESPCKTFRCKWIDDLSIPEWMKPNLSNVILVDRVLKDVQYLEVTETGKKLDSEVLSWLVMQYANGKIPNIAYQLNGGWNYIRTAEFIALFTPP